MRMVLHSIYRSMFVSLFALALGACGGGGGGESSPAAPQIPAPTPSPTPSPDPPSGEIDISLAEGARFLRQASFGPVEGDVVSLQTTGYEGWIDNQMNAPASSQLQHLLALPLPENAAEGQRNRVEAFFKHALENDDQLRQRMAFALSEIMVVSDQGALSNRPGGLASYYDMLSEHAFGNFRDLIEAVTLHPAMGVYLSMLGNEKPDTARNIRPDENYARESLQLFTIGTVELNLDGTPRLDNAGQLIPTYDQTIIEGFAHVYTGWTFGGSARFNRPSRDYLVPMQAFSSFHDNSEKKLLNGFVIPAGQTPEQDLTDALDNIFAHQNVAPFISRRLIQRFISANPSSSYVERVATVFNDNGFGVRGDLGAVIKAILLDVEARTPVAGGIGGKLVEPLLRLVSLWRAFDASAPNGRYIYPQPNNDFGQAPLRSPSVFNFFSPDYAPAGELSDQGLVSPEMQITNETTTASVNDYLALSIYIRNSNATTLGNQAIRIDIAPYLALSGDPEVLLQRMAEKLTGGVISSELEAEALAMIN
ncbi:MAG: DUF1800 domain-containing protein, partial [Gammaproteobacteria bacterium]|nr:DUF1800 domain-containing protein [Gammaproteobacteria bacterium]